MHRDIFKRLIENMKIRDQYIYAIYEKFHRLNGQTEKLLSKAIEKKLEEARRHLHQAWKDHQTAEAAQGEKLWRQALQTFEQQIEAINQEINSYNLSVPLDRFQRRSVLAKREVDRLTTLPLSDTL